MMISDVAPIPWKVVMFVILLAKEGINAITPNAIAPINVVLDKILSKASAVGLPGLTPGIEEPYFLRLFAMSFGCIFGIIDA